MLALEKPLFSQPSSAGISKYHVRTIIIENLKFVPVLSCPENFPRVSQQSFLDHLHISFEFFASPINNTTLINFFKALIFITLFWYSICLLPFTTN